MEFGFLSFGLSSVVSSSKYLNPSGDFSGLCGRTVSTAADVHFLCFGSSS